MDSEYQSVVTEQGEKIILIGDPSVGKSSILTRYINKTFTDNMKPTIGVEHYSKEIPIQKTKITLSIWDTAGQERYRGLTSAYYKETKCIVLVFDITNRQSFDRLYTWKEEIENYTDKDLLTVVIGNKSDLQEKRKVNKEEIEGFVKKFRYFYMETSALENKDGNIEEVFRYIAENLYRCKLGDFVSVDKKNISKGDIKVLKLDDGVKKGEKKCC